MACAHLRASRGALFAFWRRRAGRGVVAARRRRRASSSPALAAWGVKRSSCCVCVLFFHRGAMLGIMALAAWWRRRRNHIANSVALINKRDLDRQQQPVTAMSEKWATGRDEGVHWHHRFSGKVMCSKWPYHREGGAAWPKRPVVCHCACARM